MGRSTKEFIACLVCGDRSYGRHYGVFACDGCSCFFKRTVRRNLVYSCTTGSAGCVINKAKRNWCPHCRFRKCLAVKMDVKAVQNERGPRKRCKFPSNQLSQTSHILSNTTVHNELVAEVLIDAIKDARYCSVISRLCKREQDEILSLVWPVLFVLRASYWHQNFLSALGNEIITQLMINVRRSCLSAEEVECLKKFSLARYDLVTSHLDKLSLIQEQEMAIKFFPGPIEKLTYHLYLIPEILRMTSQIETVLFTPIIGPVPLSRVVRRI